MKKVLIITYDWPPAGGSGVQRILKFCKYLPEFGWKPIVLTVDRGEYHATDGFLAEDIPESAEVFKTAALEPHRFYKRFTGMKADEKIPVAAVTKKDVGWKDKISFWINTNVFVPDTRIGWIPFAVKEGKKIIKNLSIDLIFSSAPPPTLHLIAKRLARWSGLKWIADFRDPWTGIYYFTDHRRMFLSRKIDERLERSVLRDADGVVSVGNVILEEDLRVKSTDRQKFYYIPNGYDEDDFQKYFKDGVGEDSKRIFRLVHCGTVCEKRVPVNLFKTLDRLAREGLIAPNDFSVTFVGNVTPSLVEECRSWNVEKFITFIPYVPHREIFKYMRTASMLLLLIPDTDRNEGILTGKVFEYLRSGKPIMGMGPEKGEVAEIVRRTKSGVFVGYGDFEKLYRHLKESLGQFRRGVHLKGGSVEDVEKFDRKNLTKQLADVFKTCLEKVDV